MDAKITKISLKRKKTKKRQYARGLHLRKCKKLFLFKKFDYFRRAQKSFLGAR